MFEVEVARFQNTHHLNTFDRLSVEGNSGGRDNLRNQSLQGEGIDLKNAVLYEITQTIQQRVHAEQALLGQRRGLYFIFADGFRNSTDNRHQP